jgi:ankyrin repeat protein
VIGGGTPLDDATAFAQWRAGYRLVERGARTTLWHAATLDLSDRLDSLFAGSSPPDAGDVDGAFWGACHGGRQRAAAYLLDRGADLNGIPDWENLTPLDAAVRSGATELADWLRDRGATTAQ